MYQEAVQMQHETTATRRGKRQDHAASFCWRQEPLAIAPAVRHMDSLSWLTLTTAERNGIKGLPFRPFNVGVNFHGRIAQV